MLLNLYVKNLALIDEAEIGFTEGLNILTGETGAGKSVLVGSVNLALGEKADPSLIRDGAEYALIEMTFRADDEETIARIREMDIPVEEDQTIVLQRRLMRGRSVCKVSGETVTLKQLRALAAGLIHIHGQNDQQSLLRKEEQRAMLDACAGEAAEKPLGQVREAYRAMREKEKAFAQTDMDHRTRQREMDLIRYELKEIDDAALQEHEDEALEEAFRKMESVRRNAETLSQACACLAGDGQTVSEQVSRAVSLLSGIARNDTAAEGFHAQLSEIENLLTDVTRDLQDYLSDTSFSEEEYVRVTDRLNLINRLKEKYASANDGTDAVLRYRDKREQELSRLADLDAYRETLREEIDAERKKALKAAGALSALREKTAKRLSADTETVLKELNFKDVRFEIETVRDEETLGEYGFDRITFLISPNAGEKLRPLSEIASGGELSRIMLALQTAMADRHDALAMIFDEIDAGISGRTAWMVSRRLCALAKTRQVICITHLAQIASMADTHDLIYKERAGERTVTRIRRLDEEESIRELARLIGTDELTDEAVEGAKKMRDEALLYKRDA